jgi:hypothetical protein
LSYLMAPRPARLPHLKPTTIKPKDSRYDRGTTGGQVSKHVHYVFKTPLWRSVLKLDSDDMLQPVLVQ